MRGALLNRGIQESGKKQERQLHLGKGERGPKMVVLFSRAETCVCSFLFCFFPKLHIGRLRSISELALMLHGHNVSEFIVIPYFHLRF